MSLYETAKYEVLDKEGKFEIREYEPYYTAAVPESDPVETYGFNQIFNYISGNNGSKEKISMTTPVFNELENGKFTTEFVMPGKYREQSPPMPDNERIALKKSEKKQCASVTFSGTVSEERIKQYEEELLDWLIAKGRIPSGTFRLARYNPPIVPPPLRRNEILIDLQPTV